MDVKSAVLATVLIATIIPIFPINNVYAIDVDCNGNTIERGDFDSDGIDEVKVNGIVYEDGDNITLDGITYTIRISNGIFIGTDENDFIVGTNSDDIIDGGDGDDFIVGLNGYDAIYGGDGDDIICGNNGNDFIIGDGNDTSYGGDDTIYGGDDGNGIVGDYINGGDGDDTIYGGDDTINGGEW